MKKKRFCVPHLTTKQIHELFLRKLDGFVVSHSDVGEKPLEVELKVPQSVALRVYFYSCTCPAGGRALDEFKCQLKVPGQGPGDRADFDYSDGRIVLLGACAEIGQTEEDEKILVFWDPVRHANFSYSTNLQVKLDLLTRALLDDYSVGRKRNGEIVIAVRPSKLKNIVPFLIYPFSWEGRFRNTP